MSGPCTHLESIETTDAASDGCEDCIKIGSLWVHLRRCTTCGHVGCCDSSPNRHATAHFSWSQHPIMQSFEPGENWFWCFLDEVAFELPSTGRAPSHP